MRRLLLFPALLLIFNAVSRPAAGQDGATATVTANPSTLTAGGGVALDATVQPTNASVTPSHAFTKPTGTINFLDGSTPLSSAPIALVSNLFASATFAQVFGTPNAALTQNVQELTGDMNGDGVADLLLYSFPAAQAFISNGKGGYTSGALQTLSFTSSSAYPSVASVPTLIDVNGDGKLDLLDGVQVAYGNGDGTFAAPIRFRFSPAAT